MYTMDYLTDDEHFTVSESTYAVDNCGANWLDHAVKSARVFSDSYSTSNEEEKIALVKNDLENCEFTAEEINHAISVVFGA